MTIQNLLSSTVFILLIIVVSISHKQCSKNKELLQDIQSLKKYESEAKHYKGKNGELISYNNTLTVSLESLRKEKSDLAKRLENMRIKKPELVVVTNTETVVDSIFVPFDSPIPCDDYTSNFLYQDSIWLSINGRVNQLGVFVDNITMENEILWVLGEKKNGLFKRNEHVVSLEMSSPYFRATHIEPYIIRKKPAFYDRLWFKGVIFVGGIATGVALSQ